MLSYFHKHCAFIFSPNIWRIASGTGGKGELVIYEWSFINSRGRTESLSSLSFFVPHVCHLHVRAAVFLPPALFPATIVIGVEERRLRFTHQRIKLAPRKSRRSEIKMRRACWKQQNSSSRGGIASGLFFSSGVISVSSRTDLIEKTHQSHTLKYALPVSECTLALFFPTCSLSICKL